MLPHIICRDIVVTILLITSRSILPVIVSANRSLFDRRALSNWGLNYIWCLQQMEAPSISDTVGALPWCAIIIFTHMNSDFREQQKERDFTSPVQLLDTLQITLPRNANILSS